MPVRDGRGAMDKIQELVNWTVGEEDPYPLLATHSRTAETPDDGGFDSALSSYNFSQGDCFFGLTRLWCLQQKKAGGRPRLNGGAGWRILGKDQPAMISYSFGTSPALHPLMQENVPSSDTTATRCKPHTEHSIKPLGLIKTIVRLLLSSGFFCLVATTLPSF
jgi:hypothetical protein